MKAASWSAADGLQGISRAMKVISTFILTMGAGSGRPLRSGNSDGDPPRNGTIASHRLNPPALVANIIGKIWALPNTIVGLAAEVVLAPFAYANGGRFRVANNAIQLTGIPFLGGAITIGNTQLYFAGTNPASNVTYRENGVNTGLHEQYHTYQNQVLGVFFWPLYLLSGPVADLRNPFEQAAQNYSRAHTRYLPEAG
jgi:hypothetical protein